MNRSVAAAKEADAKKKSSPTHSSEEGIHRVQYEPERQLGSLRGVIGNITRNGGKPSVESIVTHLSSMHTIQRAPTLLALQRTRRNLYVQRQANDTKEKLPIPAKTITPIRTRKVQRQKVEGFGYDFGQVRVHHDETETAHALKGQIEDER